MYEQRDIVVVPFPNSDLTGAKRRPALIISNSTLNKTNDRLCCFITSNPDAAGIPIANASIERGKLPLASKVKPQRVFTIDARLVKKTVCRTTKAFHGRIVAELQKHVATES